MDTELVHVELKKYARLDGINKTWLNEKDQDLSLKIKDGVLFIICGRQLLESVNLQEWGNVKIAKRKRILAFAVIQFECVVRFRVEFSKTKNSEMKTVVEYITEFLPITRIEDNKNESVDDENTPQIFKKYSSRAAPYFSEIQLKDIKKLAQLSNKGQEFTDEDLLVMLLDVTFIRLLKNCKENKLKHVTNRN